ncbi:MAG: ulcer associated adenine specific DNA methyltransferase [Candidatus Jettenia ecosi]|uniref:Ulcer associated adenine specific DNA methyltransferase n=1 Tax=Candidatus Jettenia ecosi TaxID=2494326 RepID=A0A533QE35_9BACT|nr:MAG: ulcer associated adenine specific DNA methyltransferase [Candidatus Jettenia ecosi]
MTKIFNKELTFIENSKFPSTRFQGSKLKIADWIWEGIKDLRFQTVLDAFGGTGSMAYVLKQKGKTVTYNDILKFNYYIGLALVENDSVILSNEDVNFLLKRHGGIAYLTFIAETFKDVYYTDKENRWIDMVVANIRLLNDKYKQALAYFALFQACIAKRPFNLFHRKNLYLRFADIKRNFGNKATWDTPFEAHFRRFVKEANNAVFSHGQRNRALNLDVFDVKGDFDLVYIDTPYISKKGVGIDYLGFYHFLEGLVNYEIWSDMIDYKSKHKRLKIKPSVWADKNKIHAAFNQLFQKFRDSIIVVSYRSDGIPSVEELAGMLSKYKRTIHEIRRKDYKYVLSKNEIEEILFIGE